MNPISPHQACFKTGQTAGYNESEQNRFAGFHRESLSDPKIPICISAHTPFKHRTIQSKLQVSRGFTLVEMVVVIAIMGIVLSIVGLTMERPLMNMLDTMTRAALIEQVDNALLRIKQDLQQALPYSIRVTHKKNQITSIEFIPVHFSGRYCSKDTTTVEGLPCNELDFTQADTVFDTIGPFNNNEGNAPIETQATWIVIQNIDQTHHDTYQGDNRAEIKEKKGQRIELAHPFQFSFPSPTNQFQVVSTPVRYICNPKEKTLKRYWDYGWQATTASARVARGKTALLATDIHQCNFNLVQTKNKNKVVSLTLQGAQNHEQVALTYYIPIHEKTTLRDPPPRSIPR